MPFKPLRDAAAAATLGAALQVSAQAQGAATPRPPTLVGHPIADAEASEFVQFFHLQQVFQAPDTAHPGTTLTVLGSTGQFKGVVNLMLTTTDGDPAVTRAGLMVRRDFIDGPATAVFARDVAKSFLEISTGRDVPEVQALHDHLWKHQPSDAPAAQAWAGRQDKHRIDFAGGYLMLQNAAVMQVPMLVIENGPAAP